MIKTLGSDISSTVSLGENVNKIYSFGEEIWSKDDSPYIPLEYIECTGTQHSLLDVYNDGEVETIEEIMILSSAIKEVFFFGGRKTTSIGYGLYYTTNNNILSAYGTGFSPNIIPYIKLNTWYNVELSSQGFTINDRLYPRVGTIISDDNKSKICLDSMVTAGVIDPRKFIGRKRRFIHIKNGKILIDAFPCKLKSNGKIGRWDYINNIFIQNDGTGNYIAGPERTEPYTRYQI